MIGVRVTACLATSYQREVYAGEADRSCHRHTKQPENAVSGVKFANVAAVVAVAVQARGLHLPLEKRCDLL